MFSRTLALLAVLGATHAAHARCDTSAVYKRATGHTVDARCSRSSATFGGVTVVGSFADDRGCMADGVIVGCAWNPPHAAAGPMAAAGWAKANLAGKQALALAWLAEIDDVRPLSSAPPKLTKQTTTYAPPSSVARGGGLVLELWSAAPAGMRDITVYEHQRVVFEADGTHGSIDVIETVEIPGHGG